MKNFTKAICVFLAVIMSFTMVMPAFAADSKNIVCPEIYVHGFATGEIYAEKDGVSESISDIDTDALLGMVEETIVPAMLTFAVDGDAQKLAYAISGVIGTAFEDWFNNPDGSPKNNSGAKFVYPTASSIQKTSRLSFMYDWRGDPIEIAAQLNDYIDYVLAATGCEKVALSAHSLGSVIILSYISIYGDDKVMGIVFDTPAINGLTSVGELFCGKAYFKEEAVATIFKTLFGYTEYEELLSSIVDIFTMAGINGSMSDFLNDAYDEVGAIVMEETLFPLFGSWLSVWAMVPDEYIEEVMEYSFDSGVYAEDYDALKVRVQEYNEKVRADKTQTLLDFDVDGKIAVISRYGYNSVPVTEEWGILSDTVIETRSSSLGATTAPVGEILSEEYLKDKDMKYISPDKTIDASTCLFPDKTWFIKDSNHHENKVTAKYYSEFLFSEEEVTCETSSLSRFMLYDRENNVLVEDSSEPVVAEKTTVFRRVFNFIKALINKLLELLGK